MFNGFLAEFYKGFVALLIGFVCVIISILEVKRKHRFEQKYHTFFWIGLLFILIALWFLFH